MFESSVRSMDSDDDGGDDETSPFTEEDCYGSQAVLSWAEVRMLVHVSGGSGSLPVQLHSSYASWSETTHMCFRNCISGATCPQYLIRCLMRNESTIRYASKFWFRLSWYNRLPFNSQCTSTIPCKSLWFVQANNNDSLRLVCAYHRTPVPKRGETTVFHPLEHLQPMNFSRSGEIPASLMGIRLMDRHACRTSLEVAEVTLFLISSSL